MRRARLEGSRPGRVTLAGRELVHFGGCDYLGLSTHPAVLAAVRDATARYGISAGAARETSGNTVEHESLESELAAFLEVDAALLAPEGWLANVACAEALAGGDEGASFYDEGSHPSIPGALRAAGTRGQAFAHLDAVDLLRRIDRAGAAAARAPRVYSDGLFPAEGARAPVHDLLRCLPPGGVLVLDECHALGVLGTHGRGSCEAAGLRDERVVRTGTLGKSLGCYGGFVAGRADWVRAVRERSQAYGGTTPVPPALAAGARAALECLAQGTLLARMRHNTARLCAALQPFAGPAAAALGASELRCNRDVPVAALWFDDEARGERVQRALLEAGFFVPLIRYPPVPPADGSAGSCAVPAQRPWLRVSVHASHEDAQIDALAACLRACGP